MEERFIHVQRTARYHIVGTPMAAREIWIVVHGYGQLARYFLNNFEDLSTGRCIAAPEGLSRFYLDAKHDRIGATWMTREDRLHEIEDHVAYLDAVADLLLQEAMPGATVNVLGFSQGVATAARWAYLGRTRPARLIFWGGSLPPELADDELKARWSTMRVDLVHGAKDELVPPAVTEKNERMLKKAGIRSNVHRHDGGHSLDKVLLERLFADR